MKNKQYDYLFKFVMVGNSAVGKSSLLLRFADDQFNQNYMITIGVDFRFKSLKLNQKIIKLQIWDTAGQQRFRTIVNTYYKNSHSVFMIFDVGSQQSFNDIKTYWINQVQSYTDEVAQLVLVGNKADGKRQVSNEEIESFIKQKNLIYFQTSAKTGANVKQMFEQVAGSMAQRGHKNKVQKQQNTNPTTKLTQQKSKNSMSNCQC